MTKKATIASLGMYYHVAMIAGAVSWPAVAGFIVLVQQSSATKERPLNVPCSHQWRSYLNLHSIFDKSELYCAQGLGRWHSRQQREGLHWTDLLLLSRDRRRGERRDDCR